MNFKIVRGGKSEEDSKGRGSTDGGERFLEIDARLLREALGDELSFILDDVAVRVRLGLEYPLTTYQLFYLPGGPLLPNFPCR